MKLNKLFTILMAAAVILGFAGCKNDLTLAEKLVGTGGGNEPSVKYNINWNTTKIDPDGLNKTPYELAKTASKIVLGYDKDYSSIIADSSYTKYFAGATDNDLIYAYYKSAAPSEIYFLSEGQILFSTSCKINAGDEAYPYYVGPFGKCSEAKSIILKNINTESLTKMDEFFYYCEKVKTIDLSGLDTENVTSMNYMFEGCYELVSIDISMLNTRNLKSMSNMFNTVGEGNSLETIVFGNFDTSTVTDMSALFYSCSSLKNVDLSKFNTSKVTDMSEMFSRCSNLESINISSFNTSNVTNMSDMFSHCEKIKNFDLSNFNTSKVTDMGSMLSSCYAMESVNLSSFVTSKVETMSHMFEYSNTISTLDLSSFTFESIDSAGYMFSEATKLKTIYVKEGTDLSNIEDLSCSSMFSECTSLIGGKGTVFDSAKTDKTYARIDGGSAAPGYFTKKGDSSGEQNFACSNCGAKYATQALADACDKEYGCPSFDITKNPGKAYYSFMGMYIRFDTNTGNITNVWIAPADYNGKHTVYIPDASYHDELLTLDDGEDNSWARYTNEGKRLLEITAAPLTNSYTLDYYELSEGFVALGYKYTPDIKTAFPDKASPILPAANAGHDVFYIKGDNVYIFDLTNNTFSLVDGTDARDTNNQIVITDTPAELSIKSSLNFPDMTTAVRVSNDCSHQIIVYEDTSESIGIGRVPATPTNTESPCCAPIYKTTDNKYFSRCGI